LLRPSDCLRIAALVTVGALEPRVDGSFRRLDLVVEIGYGSSVTIQFYDLLLEGGRVRRLLSSHGEPGL